MTREGEECEIMGEAGRERPDDKSGDLIVQRLTDAGHQLADRAIVKDLADQRLEGWIADPEGDCIISTGGTGLTGRDVTREAFARVWEKEITGFGELFDWLSYQTVGTSPIQSRACAVAPICSRSQGSLDGAADGRDGILATQFDSRHRPRNLVELMGCARNETLGLEAKFLHMSGEEWLN